MKDKALDHFHCDCHTTHFVAATAFSFTQCPEISNGIQKCKAVQDLARTLMLQIRKGVNSQLQIGVQEVKSAILNMSF